jgi:tetratricopeptide (TPR) repeat protein
VNDSKGAVGSHLDRHEHLGEGTCGKACFESVARMKRFANVPCILETAKEGTLRGKLPDLANAAWLRALACVALCAGAALAQGGCRAWAKPDSQVAQAEASIPADATPEEAARIAAARQAAAQGDHRRAMQDLGTLLEENPRLVDAKVAIGDAARVQGDLRAALRTYEAALQADPRNQDARVGIAQVHEAAGRWEDAVRAWRQALLASPHDQRALAGIVRCLQRTGDEAGALPFLERLAADPGADSDTWAALGHAHLVAGRNADAVAAYEEAVELGEVAQATMDGLVTAYSAEGRWAEAASTAEESARRWPSARSSERAAWLCFRQGDMARAAALYRRAAQQDPASVRAWNGVGACALNAWLLSDRLDGAARDEARRAFERSLALDGAQPQVRKIVAQYRP